MNTNNITHQLTALDAEEAAEWRESVQSLLQASGPQAVRQVMDMLSEMARNPAIGWKPTRSTRTSTPSRHLGGQLFRATCDRGTAGLADALDRTGVGRAG